MSPSAFSTPFFKQQSTEQHGTRNDKTNSIEFYPIIALPGRNASQAADDVQANLAEAQDLWSKQKTSAEEAEQEQYGLLNGDSRQLRRERIEPILVFSHRKKTLSSKGAMHCRQSNSDSIAHERKT